MDIKQQGVKLSVKLHFPQYYQYCHEGIRETKNTVNIFTETVP